MEVVRRATRLLHPDVMKPAFAGIAVSRRSHHIAASPEQPMTKARPVVFAAFLLFGANVGMSAQAPAKKEAPPEKVSYYKDVRPIIQQHCQGCHQPAKAQGGIVMTDFAELFKKTEHDAPGITPGKPAQSAIYTQIIPHGGKPPAMPRGKDPLTDHDVKIIERWIAQGAAD